MDKKKKNPHEGHRKRIREKFLKDGSLLNYPEHNILELILFYSAPRSDTNELAHKLIKHFGSLRGVLNAPYDALQKINGVGEHTAVLLMLINGLINKSLADAAAEIRYINNDSDALQFIRPIFHGLKTEQLIMLCLNNNGKILQTVTLSEGGHDFACIDTRKMIQQVLYCNATQVIIVHNHPGGICAPSASDLEATSQLAKILYSLNATLINHIIVTDDDHFSFNLHENTAKSLVVHDADKEKILKVAEGETK